LIFLLAVKRSEDGFEALIAKMRGCVGEIAQLSLLGPSKPKKSRRAIRPPAFLWSFLEKCLFLENSY
jgi:hypothetical protein